MKRCGIVNCVDPKCPCAHTDEELRDIHPDFDENLIGGIFPDIARY
jgi:hypothetical protein